MSRRAQHVLGVVAPLLLWLAIKFGFDISDRYLPGPNSLVAAGSDIGWPIFLHLGATTIRAVLGFGLGVLGGIAIALVAFRLRILPLIMPTVNSLRAVPALAAVPFFLLWFGFAEIGRYLLVAMGLGLNVLVSSADVLERPREIDVLNFKNFGLPPERLILSYWFPRIVEGILPTLRFGLALGLSLIVVSEMLGAQYGLGYLMQTSRATFSLNVLFLCALLLGILAAVGDSLLRSLWRAIVTWRIG
jgi:ABC-type nitrate/sulfonate/bicarbonate transport system permease component